MQGVLNRLNKTATAIFMAMVDQMKAQGEDHLKIDNNSKDSGLMAVHLEYLHCTIDLGGSPCKLYSLAHYYEQEGDLMRDPDVQFLVKDIRTGENNLELVAIYPISFRQDGILGVDRMDVTIEDGKVVRYSPSKQKDTTQFCNMWMKNIKDQQGIKLPKNVPLNNAPKGIVSIYKEVAKAAAQLGYKSLSAALAAGKDPELLKQIAKNKAE